MRCRPLVRVLEFFTGAGVVVGAQMLVSDLADLFGGAGGDLVVVVRCGGGVLGHAGAALLLLDAVCFDTGRFFAEEWRHKGWAKRISAK